MEHLASVDVACPGLAAHRSVCESWEHRLQEAREHYRSHKMSEADITKKLTEMQKDLQSTVEQDVRIYLILDKIEEAVTV